MICSSRPCPRHCWACDCCCCCCCHRHHCCYCCGSSSNVVCVPFLPTCGPKWPKWHRPNLPTAHLRPKIWAPPRRAVVGALQTGRPPWRPIVAIRRQSTGAVVREDRHNEDGEVHDNRECVGVAVRLRRTVIHRHRYRAIGVVTVTVDVVVVVVAPMGTDPTAKILAAARQPGWDNDRCSANTPNRRSPQKWPWPGRPIALEIHRRDAPPRLPTTHRPVPLRRAVPYSGFRRHPFVLPPPPFANFRAVLDCGAAFAGCAGPIPWRWCDPRFPAAANKENCCHRPCLPTGGDWQTASVWS
mmetsp:Transcript_19525/g.46313  ORF Transcript_19525/g.46313 Transcript_19525/m.46313 type:complete len:299 (+) Transcript_19525:94-990(+)